MPDNEAFWARVVSTGGIKGECRGGDSNPYFLRNQILSLALIHRNPVVAMVSTHRGADGGTGGMVASRRGSANWSTPQGGSNKDVEEEANEDEEVVDEIMTAGAKRTMEAYILQKKKVSI